MLFATACQKQTGRQGSLRKKKTVKEASKRVDQAFSVGATGVEKELLRVEKATHRVDTHGYLAVDRTHGAGLSNMNGLRRALKPAKSYGRVEKTNPGWEKQNGVEKNLERATVRQLRRFGGQMLVPRVSADKPSLRAEGHPTACTCP